MSCDVVNELAEASHVRIGAARRVLGGFIAARRASDHPQSVMPSAETRENAIRN